MSTSKSCERAMSARFAHAQQTHTPSRRAVVRAVHRCDLFPLLLFFFSFFLSACLLAFTLPNERFVHFWLVCGSGGGGMDGDGDPGEL